MDVNNIEKRTEIPLSFHLLIQNSKQFAKPFCSFLRCERREQIYYGSR